MKIGDNIKRIRKSKKISQKDLAATMEIPVSTLANYENNHREPNVNMMNKIADALNVSISELIGEESLEYRVNKSIYTNMDDETFASLFSTIDFSAGKHKSFSTKEKEAFIEEILHIQPYKIQLQNYLNNFSNFTIEDLVDMCNSIRQHYITLLENFISDEYNPLYEDYIKTLEMVKLQSERIKSQDDVINGYENIYDKIKANNESINKIINSANKTSQDNKDD